MTNGKIVLVTGGSGFIALHVILNLLQKGYQVRATLRSLNRARDVRSAIRNAGMSEDIVDAIEFVEVNLLSDKGWMEAAAGAHFVLHVASPFPASEPENEEELVQPAREGTLRALRAAKISGTVQRVVLTSSVAAVSYGHASRSNADSKPFTEMDWTEIEKPITHLSAYIKSKTIAERAAWDWLANAENENSFELATVNPVLVCGPALGNDNSASLEIPKRLLSGKIPGILDIHFGIVDVRDVADLHVMVMESPRAAGQRYLAVSDEQSVSMKEMVAKLRNGLPADDTRHLPSITLPTLLLRFVGYFDKLVSLFVPELGIVRPVSNAKASEELGWCPRSAEEALVASGQSLKAQGQI